MSWKEFCDINQVGSRFHNASLSDFDNDLLDRGKEWLCRPCSLVLTGNAGRGKTYFSFALIREIIKRYDRSIIRWIKSKHLDDEIVAATNSDVSGQANFTIKKFCDIEILFIDDFGIDRSTERSSRDYYEIIDTRWENNKPTILSTNLNNKEIYEAYGPRIHSRLKDFGWIVFDGPDLRGSHA